MIKTNHPLILMSNSKQLLIIFGFIFRDKITDPVRPNEAKNQFQGFFSGQEINWPYLRGLPHTL